MSSVQSWVIDMLRPDEDEQQQIKVTLRLDPADYFELKKLAVQLGVSPTRTATGLLTHAIADAWQML
ncbi:MAG: hypothetical protein EOO38_04395, partial [Cytophagaceae bacterium]